MIVRLIVSCGWSLDLVVGASRCGIRPGASWKGVADHLKGPLLAFTTLLGWPYHFRMVGELGIFGKQSLFHGQRFLLRPNSHPSGRFWSPKQEISDGFWLAAGMFPDISVI